MLFSNKLANRLVPIMPMYSHSDWAKGVMVVVLVDPLSAGILEERKLATYCSIFLSPGSLEVLKNQNMTQTQYISSS